ncbi:MAG: ATPase, T2SS/T4P/T4SS family, partial [Gemmatimonadaceae bacterium]
ADRLIADAITAGASDVQFEPTKTGGIVRFRIDGVVRPYAELGAADFERLVARVKAMGRLATAVRTRPQEGKINLSAGPAAGLELRVATIPTREGERATVRIPTAGDARSLTEIDAMPDVVARLRDLISARSGLVLVCGAQSSGRTTTAYALAREIVAHGTPVTSIEDPIETCVPGVSQMQVDIRTGLTVAALTGEAMAADGAAVLVGELRDRETADLAVQAATTGHLVVAVLQASSALGAIDRLGELGLGRTRIAAALHGVVAQHLLRRVCAACKGTPSAAGCAACGRSGFRGRVPVIEIVTATPALRELIADGAPPSVLQRTMVASGARSMEDSVNARIEAGHTTRAEAERVIGCSPQSHGAARPNEPRRILVADDDEIARHLACTLLAQQGFEVHEACDGAVAIEMLSSDRRFDAVILDLHMPRADGRSVIEHIRRTPKIAALPVVVLTGSGDNSTEVEIIDAGADDYLSKPADPPRFLARVRAVLRRAAA